MMTSSGRFPVARLAWFFMHLPAQWLRALAMLVLLLASWLLPGALGFAQAEPAPSAEPAKLTAPFDPQPYDTNLGFDNPMSTIAGLTDYARDINYVYAVTTIIVTLIFFAVCIPVVIVVMKFRAKPGETDEVPPKQVHGNPTLEFLWTVIPCVLLVVIAIPTWKVIFKQAADPSPDALRVEVIGHQWWWEFRYPEQGIITANELVLPENREIAFRIWSADVIHSFWIPKFGGKVDALPGDHINTMLFTTPELAADKRLSGDTFQGHCVELCGLSHALMRFNVTLRTAEQFDSWARSFNAPPVVATEQQKKGEQAFAKCVACHTISGTPSEQIPGEKIGPSLTNFGNRAYLGAGTRLNTPENLAAWLADPAAIKPGSLMPNLGLSKDEISELSAYLRQSTAKAF